MDSLSKQNRRSTFSNKRCEVIISRSSEKECAKLFGAFRCFKSKQDEEEYNSSPNCCLAKEHTRFKVFSSIKALNARLVVRVGLQGLLDSNYTNYCNDIRRVTR